MVFQLSNSKQIIINNINKTHTIIQDCNFLNTDFRNVLKKISFKNNLELQKVFLYCDPPYLNTTNNYSNSFTEQDTIDLFEICVNSGIKFAISEFDNEFVKDLALKYGLNIIPIKERRTLNNRNTEILITNYESENKLFN